MSFPAIRLARFQKGYQDWLGRKFKNESAGFVRYCKFGISIVGGANKRTNVRTRRITRILPAVFFCLEAFVHLFGAIHPTLTSHGAHAASVQLSARTFSLNSLHIGRRHTLQHPNVVNLEGHSYITVYYFFETFVFFPRPFYS